MVFFGTGPNTPYFLLTLESRYTGRAPDSTTPWCTLLWQLRSSSSFSPGAISVCRMTLLAVEVPLVAKKVLRAPNALAAICCASAITPVGSISESSALTETDRSASQMCSPMNS